MRSTHVVFSFVIFLTTVSPAQRAILCSTTAKADWAIETPEQIRFGQIVIARHPSDDRMTIASLRTQLPGMLQVSERPLPPPHPSSQSTKAHRAAWVWNTDALMRDSVLQQKLIAYLCRERMDRVFLQLPEPIEEKSTGRVSFDTQRLSRLIAQLTNAAVSVFALEGSPSFIQPERQPILLRLCKAVIAYNQKAARESRFAGVHLDVEPYLIAGFNGAKRNDILRSYLEMLTRAGGALRGSGLTLGVDIPAWFDGVDEWTNEPFELTDGDRKRTLLECVLDRVDEIAVMSYRAVSEGERGIVQSAEYEVRLAGTMGKRAYVSLETEPLPDEWLGVFRGEPYAGTPIAGSAPYHVTVRARGDSLDCWFIPDDQCAGWNEGKSVSERESFFSWSMPRLSFVPASSITFAGRTSAEIDSAVMSIYRAFSGEEGFAGIAVHHWERHEAITRLK